MERSAKKIIHKLAITISSSTPRTSGALSPRRLQLRRGASAGRSAYVPRRVYEAPAHTEPIASRSRRIGTTEQPPPKAAPKIIFGSKPPLPKELPRAASSVPAKAAIPTKSPPRARSPTRTQSAFGYKAPPRGLNKAEPRSKSGSNPPQGYIVKPPPPQVAKAAALLKWQPAANPARAPRSTFWTRCSKRVELALCVCVCKIALLCHDFDRFIPTLRAPLKVNPKQGFGGRRS